jgi:hypothetical protein
MTNYQGSSSSHPKKQQHQPRNRAARRLIVGGHNIDPGRYPYFVSIDKNNGVVVNGVLIAPDIVLSAGHVALSNMDNLTIKVGPYAVHEQEGFAETIPPSDTWLVPTNWSQFSCYQDLTLFYEDYLILKLSRPSTHAPISLNRNVAIPQTGDRVVMAGLGWTNESYVSPSSIVQEVELVYLDSVACALATDNQRNMTYRGKIDESMLCTISPPNTTRDGWYVKILVFDV